MFAVDDPQASFQVASDATRRLRESQLRSTRSFFEPDDPSKPDPGPSNRA